jgi:hypothetical protein
MNHKGIVHESMDRINLAQDIFQWWAVVNMLMKPLSYIKSREVFELLSASKEEKNLTDRYINSCRWKEIHKQRDRQVEKRQRDKHLDKRQTDT